MAAFWASMAAQDFRAALARITTPMLVIHGADSQVYPDGATAFIARHRAERKARRHCQARATCRTSKRRICFFTHVEAFVRETRRSELRAEEQSHEAD